MKEIEYIVKHHDSKGVNIKSRMGFLNHLKEGDYVRYHRNGKEMEVGHYIKGKRSGVFTHYFDSGSISKIITYKSGVIDGSVKSYFENGNLSIEQVYENGTPALDSVTKHYYQNSQLMTSQKMLSRYESEVLYFDNSGSEINKSKTLITLYHPNGRVREEIHFKDTNVSGHKLLTSGVKSGIFKSFYETGTMDVVCHFLNGKLDGDYFKKFDNGKDEAKGLYKDGTIVSLEEWYKSGRLKLEVSHNDKEILIETSYFSDGILKRVSATSVDGYSSSQSYFSDGSLESERVKSANGVVEKNLDENGEVSNLSNIDENGDGKFESFDESGLLSLSRHLVGGKANGKELIFEFGDLIQETDYLDGKKHGEVKRYYDSGVVISQSFYSDDKREGSFTHYFENGEVKLTCSYLDDKRDGYQIEYYPSGNVKNKGMFKKDLCEGLYESYHPNGKKKFFVEYENNLESGLSEGWDKAGVKTYSQRWLKGKVLAG